MAISEARMGRVQGLGGTEDCNKVNELRPADGEENGAHLAVPTLVKSDEVVLLGEARQDAVPHLLVGHERVDEDEPRCRAVPLGYANVEPDTLLDLDVVLLLGSLGEGNADIAHVSDVEGDEEARDHVVGSDDGGSLEELLVVLEVGLELVDASLRDVDREGRSVGEAKGGGLEGREGSRRGGRRKGSVKVADDGELRSGKASILSDVSVVCESEVSLGDIEVG